jgi:integrase
VPFGDVARQHLELADLAPGTRRNYESLLRTALSPLVSVPIGNLSVQRVERWWASHSGRPVNRRNAYFFMRAVFGSALRWGIVRTSPCIVKDAGADVARPRPTWTVKDFERVLEHVDPAFLAPLHVLFAGHLRVGELVGLNANDYSPATGRISVSKQYNGLETKTGQHGTPRLLDSGLVAMTGYLADHPRIGSTPLFTGPRGGRLPASTLRKAWDAGCALAGLDDFHLHDLRHVGGTEIGRVSKSPKDIQSRLRHASLSSSMRYLHSDDERDEEIALLASRRIAGRA